MNTPPAQITRPRTPSTPRYGARFELESPTRKQPPRAKKQAPSTISSNYTTSTLSPPPSSPLAPEPSPRRSPRHQKKARFALSEDEKEHSSSEEERSESRPTVRNAGGLATPAKTPRKRKLPAREVSASAKVLFSAKKETTTTSTSTTTKTTTRTLHSSLEGDLPPRTPVRKSIRRDLFGSAVRTPGRRAVKSLDDDQTEEEAIAIFTDSDARRPTVDAAPENPFNTRSSTRRKKVAKSLGEDEHREDGMYYVFRGKRIFKKFDNLPDADDRAENEDGDEPTGLNPRSIKPRLLFPTRHSRRLAAEAPEEPEVSKTDEENAETDIDEASQSQKSPEVIIHSPKKQAVRKPAAKKGQAKRNVSRMTPDSDDDEIIPKTSVFATPSNKKAAKPRLSGSRALFDEGEDGGDDFFLPARKLLFEDEDEIHAASAKTAEKGKKRAREIGLDTPVRTPRRRRTQV